jgi:hypothetical protein
VEAFPENGLWKIFLLNLIVVFVWKSQMILSNADLDIYFAQIVSCIQLNMSKSVPFATPVWIQITSVKIVWRRTSLTPVWFIVLVVLSRCQCTWLDVFGQVLWSPERSETVRFCTLVAPMQIVENLGLKEPNWKSTFRQNV